MNLKYLRHALAFAGALASLVTAGAARADVPSPEYDAQGCRPAIFNEVGRWELNDAEDSIKNKSAVTSTLYCPIKKLASGPGVTNDYIKTITLPFTYEQPGLVRCVAQTWRTGIQYGESSVDNLLTGSFEASNNQTTATTTKKNLTLAGGPWTRSGYWDGTSASFGKASWYYSMVRCSVPPGAKLWPYKVTESGTSTGYTIAPMTTCPLTSDMNWRITQNEDNNAHGPSGYVMAQAYGGFKKFYFICPVTNGQVVQLAVGHASGVNPSGCNLDSSNMAAPTWATIYTGSDWPTDVLALPYSRSLYVPSTGSHKLYCGQDGASGDSKWMSIRTLPNPSQVGKWTVTASSNAGAANQAIDRVGTTRWNTNGRGLKDAWYQVDFGTGPPPTVTNVILDAGGSTNDYARKFTVMFSSDGANWFEVSQFTGTGPLTSVTFSEQTWRFLRIRLDQDMPAPNTYWSIHELQLLRNSGY